MRWVFSESQDDEQIIERVAALDIGKAEVVCCVRLPAPGPGKRRVQEVTTHTTMVGSLSELANRLVELGVERVVMEATPGVGRDGPVTDAGQDRTTRGGLRGSTHRNLR